MPWPHTGGRVWVKATPTSVLICADDQRIATHQRQAAGRYSTNPAHLPELRADLAQRSIDYWIQRAGRLGPEIATYVGNIIASDDVLSKLRDVQAIVTHLERFPLRRAQAARRRADYFGNYPCHSLRRILEQALDLEPLPDACPQRGLLTQPRFARTAGELLGTNMEAFRDTRR